ncbi:hypothetical protein KKF34_11930, partial [Myxococcota bacterium]|nr:hypothetical protein [Myxococcota bacterium]
MRRASTLSFQESNHFSASGGFYSEFEGDTGIHEVESGSPEKSSSFPDPESPESTPPAFPESDHYSEFSPEPAINSLASGYSEYDVQGKVRKSFSTFIHSSFSETAPVPVKTAVQNCPAPLNAQSVYIDSSNQIQDHVVCATDITLDSLGRAWKQTSPDGTSTMVHHEGPFKT